MEGVNIERNVEKETKKIQNYEKLIGDLEGHAEKMRGEIEEKGTDGKKI